MDALIGRHYIALFMILLFSIRLLSERSKENSELRYFWLTVICCFLLIVEDELERFASEDPDLRFLRTFLSVSGYILRSTASVGLVLAVIHPDQKRKDIWITHFVIQRILDEMPVIIGQMFVLFHARYLLNPRRSWKRIA